MDDTASVHLQRERQDLALHVLGQLFLLRRRPVLKKLLDDIVAKNIGGEVDCLGKDFLKNQFAVVVRGAFQLLLDKARAVLVAAKLDNVSNNVLT